MATAYYTADSGLCALTAATAKTCLNVITPASFGLDLRSLTITFDGATSTAVPVLVEICYSTQAGAGTPGSSPTVQQQSGRSITVGFTAGANYSAEPTVLTAFTKFTETAYGGTIIRDFPFGEGPDQGVSAGLAIRLTAPAAVNGYVSARFGRC